MPCDIPFCSGSAAPVYKHTWDNKPVAHLCEEHVYSSWNASVGPLEDNEYVVTCPHCKSHLGIN